MPGQSKKNLSEEIARLESVLEEDPGSPEFYRLADGYTRSGRFADAARVCELGIKHHPDSSPGYVSLGRALFGAGRLADATEILRRAIELDSTHTESFRLLGEVLIRRQQDAAAVALLTEAIKAGVNDAKIASLLRRAQNSLAQEATQVTKLPPDGARGIGNRAVAGSIGSPKTEDFEIEVTKRVRSDPPPMVLTDADREKTKAIPERAIRKSAPRLTTEDLDDVTTVAQADSDDVQLDDVSLDGSTELEIEDARRTRVQQSQEEPHAGRLDWHSIGDRWERKLDAGVETDGPTADSDLRGPFMRRGELGGLPLSPLDDPLADGIPPLPPDVTDEVVLPEAQQAAASNIEDDATEETPSRSLPIEEAEVAARVADVIRARDEDGELETVEHSFAAIDSELTEAIDLADETMPPPASHAEPRRRPRWVLPLVGLLVVGGLVGGWWYLEQVKVTQQLLLVAKSARSVGTLAAWREAIGKLQGRRSKKIRAEAELLTMLAYLVYRDGDAPGEETTFYGSGWAATAARAAAALSNNRLEAAEKLLGDTPEDRADQAMRHLLLAWSSWLGGSVVEANEQIDAALAIDAKLALALLLRGHLLREQDRLQEAEVAYGRALAVSPELHLARLGQAAALLSSDDVEQRRISALLEKPVVGKVTELWARVMHAELAFLQTDTDDSSRKVLTTLISNAAVVAPSVSLYLVGAMESACDFESGRGLLQRLGEVRSDRSPAVRYRAARLAIAEGREAEAAEQLEPAKSSKSARQLRGLALVLSGQVEAAGRVLGKGDSPLQLLIAALEAPGTSIDRLRKAASEGGVARLALTLALIQRKDWPEAARSAAALAKQRRWLGRSMVALAEVQLQTHKVASALATLERIERACPGFLPARERLGRILVELGRYDEGARLLASARDRGRRTRALLGSLTVAYLEQKQKNRAAVTQRELEELAPQSAEAKLVAGYLALGQSPSVAARALAQAGDGMLALVGRGRALTALPERRASAEQVLLTAHRRDPEHPLPRLFLGELYAALPNVNKALAHFSSLIAASSERKIAPWIVARAHVGIAREGGDRQGTAIEHLKLAIKADPSSARAYRLLGEEFYDAESKTKPAVAALRKSLQLDPDDATAWYYLALAASRAEAREACKRFLKLEPSGQRALKIRRRLARLR